MKYFFRFLFFIAIFLLTAFIAKKLLLLWTKETWPYFPSPIFLTKNKSNKLMLLLFRKWIFDNNFDLNSLLKILSKKSFDNKKHFVLFSNEITVLVWFIFNNREISPKIVGSFS